MVSTIMHIIDVSIHASDFEALEPILISLLQNRLLLRANLCVYIYIPWAGRLQNFLFSVENLTVEINKLMYPYFQWDSFQPCPCFLWSGLLWAPFFYIPVIRVHVWKCTVGYRKAGRQQVAFKEKILQRKLYSEI